MRLRILADQVVAVVLRVVDEGARRAVDPVVGDNAVAGRVGAREERRVADSRLGIGMAVVRIGVVRAMLE